MIDGKECWAVIPARAGSKGLPDKNIRPFAGKPLLAWSIEQALASNYVDRVIVSSDSRDYLTIAQRFDAKPHVRQNWAARDDATNLDVLRELLDAAPNDERPGWLVVLQPTSPMRADGMIDDMAETAIAKGAAMVFTARRVDRTPWASWFNTYDNRWVTVADGSTPSRTWASPRQRLPDCVAANGNGWLMCADFATDPDSTRKVVPIIEPDAMYQDIDTIEDFLRIEKLFLARWG